MGNYEMASTLALTSETGKNDSIRELVQTDIASAFFGSAYRTSEKGRINLDLTNYFRYYDAEIRGIADDFWPPQQQEGNDLPVITHEDLLKIVRYLQGHPSTLRDDVRLDIAARSESTQQRYDRAINVAIRLWLMLNLRENEFNDRGSADDRPVLTWDEDTPFQEFVQSHFRKSNENLNASTSRLKSQFTIGYMSYVCGLTVKWTWSLEDHLRLDFETRTLHVFYDEHFLMAHQRVSQNETKRRKKKPLQQTPNAQNSPAGQGQTANPATQLHSQYVTPPSNIQHPNTSSPQAGSRTTAASTPPAISNNYTPTPTSSSPYPKDLLEETIQTLRLLFPLRDRDTREFFHYQGRKRIPLLNIPLPFYRDQPKRFSYTPSTHPFEPATEPRILDLRKYVYWRDRLLDLQEEIFLSTPVGWTQLWRDRRNPEKYSTFVIGVMVAILTVVSTVTSVIQTVYAVLGANSGSGSGASGSSNSTASSSVIH